MNGFVLYLEIDRIYRIIVIFEIAGFRMKPAIFNPLRGGVTAVILVQVFLIN